MDETRICRELEFIWFYFLRTGCRWKPSSPAKSLIISNTPQETKLKKGDTSLMSIYIYMCVCVCVLASKNEYRNLFPSIVTEKGIQMPQLSSPYHYQESFALCAVNKKTCSAFRFLNRQMMIVTVSKNLFTSSSARAWKYTYKGYDQSTDLWMHARVGLVQAQYGKVKITWKWLPSSSFLSRYL